jgi:hypothetical protein
LFLENKLGEIPLDLAKRKNQEQLMENSGKNDTNNLEDLNEIVRILTEKQSESEIKRDSLV